MNATVIDIPGIIVNISNIHLEHSTDLANVIEIKDEKGTCVLVSVCYGNIIRIQTESK